MIRRSEEHPVEERLKMRDGNGVVEVVSLEKELLPEVCFWRNARQPEKAAEDAPGIRPKVPPYP